MRKINYVFAIILLCAAACFAQDTIFHQEISWSPDGKYLSFTGMHDIDQKANTFKADIFVIKADGTGLKKITGDDTNEFYSSWSKGGKRVLFSQIIKDSKDSNLFTVKKDGTDLVQLTKDTKRNSTPAFSPDGKKIAFISTRDGDKYQIYVMNADGSNVKRLTTDSSIAYFNPMFSPDGKRIVYYSEKGDRHDQIWTMNADGSNQTLLTGGIGHNIFPAFSHDGKKIIFSSSNREGGNTSYVDGSYVYVMNADGSNLTKLGNIKSFFARFSPNGKKIAYISGGFPKTDIYIANADGSGAVKLTK